MGKNNEVEPVLNSPKRTNRLELEDLVQAGMYVFDAIQADISGARSRTELKLREAVAQRLTPAKASSQPEEPEIMPKILTFDAQVGDTDETLVSAMAGDRMIATVHMGWKGLQKAYIRMLYVAGEFRRCGVAYRMLKVCKQIAAAGGCEAIELEVDKNNTAAVALYQKLGFTVVRSHSDMFFMSAGLLAT